MGKHSLSLTLPIHKEALGRCPACPGTSLKRRALEAAQGRAFCSKAAAAARSTCLAGSQPGCGWLTACLVGMPPGWRLQGTLAHSRGLGRVFFKFRLCSLCSSEEQCGGVHRVHSLGCRVAALPPHWLCVWAVESSMPRFSPSVKWGR